MLNDSDSPQHALEKLLAWVKLSETQEVLALLKDKAEVVDKQIKLSPLAVRVTVMQVNGMQQVLPDYGTANALHHQFIGNFQGLTELQRTLERRETDLRAQLKQIEQDQTNGTDQQ